MTKLDINAVTPAELRDIPHVTVIGAATCACGREVERRYIHSGQQDDDALCRFCFGAMWGKK